MSGFPTHITHSQMQAAAKALGLPGYMVSDLHIDANKGVTVTLIIRDRNGKILVRGDDALTATVHVPLQRDETGPACHDNCFPTPDAQCSAHGEARCRACHRNPADCADPDGSCGTWARTGMHWDTCPNRVRGTQQ